MEAVELVELAKKRLGVTGNTEFAEALALRGLHSPQRVNRWITGQNNPDYEATLILLRVAGLLREKPTRVTRAERDAAAIEALLRRLEEAIGELRRVVVPESDPPPESPPLLNGV